MDYNLEKLFPQLEKWMRKHPTHPPLATACNTMIFHLSCFENYLVSEIKYRWWGDASPISATACPPPGKRGVSDRPWDRLCILK